MGFSHQAIYMDLSHLKGEEYMVDDRILALIEGEEKRKYIMTHGLYSAINAFHGLPWNDEEAERVYKICNEKGITWQEYYGIKDQSGIIY